MDTLGQIIVCSPSHAGVPWLCLIVKISLVIFKSRDVLLHIVTFFRFGLVKSFLKVPKVSKSLL